MKQHYLSLLLLLGSVQFLAAQEVCERSHCQWAFFELEETIQGEVILHEAIPYIPDDISNYKMSMSRYTSIIRIRNINDNWNIISSCQSENCLSITLVKITNQDTLRVLSYSTDFYEKGTLIYIIPDKIGSIEERRNLSFITHTIEQYSGKKKKGRKKDYQAAKAELPNRFDQLVLKTTFGSLSDKSDYERSILDCKRSTYYPIHHNSFQCDWTFFEIEQTMEGTIIKYEAQTQPCHLIGYASLAIIAINNNQDTIRVLDYCNASTFKEGEQVVIEAGEYKSPMSIPYSKTREGDKDIYRSNEFDALIFKTTYGKIINKE